MPILSVAAISKKMDERQVVDQISFTQEQGEKIAIAGETGSGKSCLMKMIGGILKADQGTIKFENERVFAPPDKLLPGHPGIVYLSQHFELHNNYYVHEKLSYANDLSEAASKKLYEICQIDHLLHRKTNSGLSGGERQRIALAMLLATKPRLLLLDEPFSNLDILHKQTIRQVVQDISSNYNCSIIMVSHDPLDILSWADTVMIMKDGQIVQKSTAKEVYTLPANAYCAGLLGDYNLVDPASSHYFKKYTGKIINKQLLIRPESITIVENDNESLAGTIQKILFYGSYYILEVMAEGKKFRVSVTHNSYLPGDHVQLQFSINDLCWV